MQTCSGISSCISNKLSCTLRSSKTMEILRQVQSLDAMSQLVARPEAPNMESVMVHPLLPLQPLHHTLQSPSAARRIAGSAVTGNLRTEAHESFGAFRGSAGMAGCPMHIWLCVSLEKCDALGQCPHLAISGCGLYVFECHVVHRVDEQTLN